jgi:hypothetical protein
MIRREEKLVTAVQSPGHGWQIVVHGRSRAASSAHAVGSAFTSRL